MIGSVKCSENPTKGRSTKTRGSARGQRPLRSSELQGGVPLRAETLIYTIYIYNLFHKSTFCNEQIANRTHPSHVQCLWVTLKLSLTDQTKHLFHQTLRHPVGSDVSNLHALESNNKNVLPLDCYSTKYRGFILKKT